MSYLSMHKMLNFCVPALPSGSDPSDFILLTSEELLYFIYRVKKWNVEVIIDGSAAASTALTSASSSFPPMDKASLVDDSIPSEINFTCKNYPFIDVELRYDHLSWQKTDTSGSESSIATCAIALMVLSVGFHTDSLYYDSGSYYYKPTITNVQISVDAITQTTAGGIKHVDIRLLSYSGTGPIFYADVNMGGKSSQLKLQRISSASAAGVSVAFNSVTFNITPEEYWPYDPEDTADYAGKDGSGPVYDSATGEQLRDPFNIVKRGDGSFYNPNYVES